MPVTYCDESYNEVMTWTADTQIAYAPNKKSGKSFHRYGKYMKAKTVGEALELGSYGLDLLFDHEKRLLWATGGPRRERPPEVLGVPREEVRAMSKTDQMLGKMYAKWICWKDNFAALEASGMTRQQLKELNDEQDPEGGKDSIVVAIGRRKAQEQAQKILEAAGKDGGRPVTDDEVLSCLRLWGFKENTNRGNVTPEGEKFVYSDTVGIIKMSTCERTLLTTGSKRYPEFTQLLCRWLRERRPAELQQDFAFTSININKNYAGRLHRDGNNSGPSFIKAFGEFTGGELNYWPSDDKKTPLEDFDHTKKVTVSIKDSLLLFDGNRGHCVNSFEGERYSLVFFSVRTWNKIPDDEKAKAVECGIPIPTEESMGYTQGLLKPSGPEGYRLCPAAADGQAADGQASACEKRAAAEPAGEEAAAKRRCVATPARALRD